jgi:hypothetical protein
MPVQPDNLKLVTVFGDRHAKGSQTTIDRHLGDWSDLIQRALIARSLGEGRPEGHLAMSPPNRGMKALATVELNVDVQDWAVDGSNSCPLRNSLAQLVEVTEPLSVLGSVLVAASHAGSDWDEVQAATRNLIVRSTSFFAESSLRTRTSPSRTAAIRQRVAAWPEH